MITVLINGILTVPIPDGFKEMTPEEMKAAFPDGIATRWAMRDPNRHTIIAIIWNESNRLLAGLTKVASLAQRAEHLTSQAYRNNSYKLGGLTSGAVDGREASGFTYEYELQGIDHHGAITVFKEGKTCLTAYLYGRKDNVEQDSALFEELLSQMRFA